MPSINKAIIIGHVGKDPETRVMPNGDAVCNFSVATSESWKDKQTGEKRDATEWHRITAFRKLGEICGQYLTKGATVYIEGAIKTRKWQDKDGQDRYTTEIVASEMKMLGGKGESGTSSTPEQKAPAGNSGGAFADFEDGVPFAPIGRKMAMVI